MTQNTSNTMRILVIEPMKRPKSLIIPHTLEAMQTIVGGYIEASYPWEDRCALVCDEEGVIKGRTLNRRISPETIIFGTFFICGIGEDDFTDLPDDLMEKYTEKFKNPEMFFLTNKNGRITINTAYLCANDDGDAAR